MNLPISPTTAKLSRICIAIAPVLLICLLSNSIVIQAGTPEEKGLAIAIEADARDTGFGDTQAAMTMTLLASDGTSVERQMLQKTLEVADDGDRTIMVFDRPRDLKGTAVLTHTHRAGHDDQWLYLPALKRVKRISSSDKSGPFMGSEFAFEDLASQEVEKYTYKYLDEELIDGDACFVVERVPVDEKSGYTRQITWIDQAEYRARKIDYYDRKGDLLKTMHLNNYQQYLANFWRPEELIMRNHQTKKSTILKYSKYQFQLGFRPEDFTRNALSNVR